MYINAYMRGKEWIFLIVDEIKKMVSQTPFKKCKIEINGIGFQVWLEK